MIYVLQHDGGCEGYSGAVACANTEEDAKALLAALKCNGGSWAVFKVPVWPEIADMSQWFSVEPVFK